MTHIRQVDGAEPRILSAKIGSQVEVIEISSCCRPVCQRFHSKMADVVPEAKCFILGTTSFSSDAATMVERLWQATTESEMFTEAGRPLKARQKPI